MKERELIAATRMGAQSPIVIDIEAFEAALRNPSWSVFCQKADAYVLALDGGTNPIQEPG